MSDPPESPLRPLRPDLEPPHHLIEPPRLQQILKNDIRIVRVAVLAGLLSDENVYKCAAKSAKKWLQIITLL